MEMVFCSNVGIFIYYVSYSYCFIKAKRICEAHLCVHVFSALQRCLGYLVSAAPSGGERVPWSYGLPDNAGPRAWHPTYGLRAPIREEACGCDLNQQSGTGGKPQGTSKEMGTRGSYGLQSTMRDRSVSSGARRQGTVKTHH